MASCKKEIFETLLECKYKQIQTDTSVVRTTYLGGVQLGHSVTPSGGSGPPTRASYCQIRLVRNDNSYGIVTIVIWNDSLQLLQLIAMVRLYRLNSS